MEMALPDDTGGDAKYVCNISADEGIKDMTSKDFHKTHPLPKSDTDAPVDNKRSNQIENTNIDGKLDLETKAKRLSEKTSYMSTTVDSCHDQTQLTQAENPDIGKCNRSTCGDKCTGAHPKVQQLTIYNRKLSSDKKQILDDVDRRRRSSSSMSTDSNTVHSKEAKLTTIAPKHVNLKTPKDDSVSLNPDQALQSKTEQNKKHNKKPSKLGDRKTSDSALTNIKNGKDNSPGLKETNTRDKANVIVKNNSNKQEESNANQKSVGKENKVTKGNGQKQKSVKRKENRTNLFLIFHEKLQDTGRLEDFINYRMGNPSALEFKVNEIEPVKHNKECTLVTLELNSNNKACAARSLLNRSNKNNPNKVLCFFDKRQALGESRHLKEMREKDVKNVVVEIYNTAEGNLTNHATKIKNQEALISDINKQIKGKRGGVHFAEFSKLCSEKDALTDKLQELNLQKNEFLAYVKCARDKLEAEVKQEKYSNKLKEIREALGVECYRLKAALPMYARRKDILDLVKTSQVSVVLGETGSGKSTQLVQYLYQAGVAGDGMLVCTQPRKIAAVSLATHVSKEMGSNVGQLVGYHVGMQEKKTAVTKIMFMTDHILLNECLKDRSLSKYSCIIIDEAHERSIYTDLLLGLVKQCLESRKDLRVVITSATIDPKIFVEYFGGMDKCPVLKVSGRTFPVDVVWDFDQLNDAPFPQNYENKAVDKAIEIHRTTDVDEGDILVFLTSAVETEKCVDKFKKAVGVTDNVCLQLHGRLRTDEQQLVFEKSPKGKRKVVFATNSAETSITIDGVKFVIDTGVVKEMKFDPKKNMSSLDVVPVSQSSADQRKGRAGRTSPGICYRLYSEKDYNRMSKTGLPEILRIQVSQAILKLLELGVDPLSFDYVEAPSKSTMQSAMDELTSMGAVDGNGCITDTGRWVARLPLEPKFGMMIKQGIDLDIPSEAIVVASCCSQSGIFYRAGSLEDKKVADMKKLKFCHEGGDLLTMLSVYREWEKEPEKKKGQWCLANSVNGKSIKGVRDMMNEILTILRKEADLKLKHVFADAAVSDKKVKKLVFDCMKGNLAYYLGHENAGFLVVNRHQRVTIHPSSTLMSLGLQPTWVVYNRLLRTSADYMTEVTPVEESYLEEAKAQKKITIDEAFLVKQRVKQTECIPVGRHVFWKFVGPFHKNRREVEMDISDVCNNTTVVVEAKKQRGEIVLFCVPEYGEIAADMLREAVKTLPLQLKNERLEQAILNKKGESTGTRLLLKEGGIVESVLLPSQFRSLNIKEKAFTQYALSRQEIEDRLSCYGPIEDLWQTTGKKNQNSIFWGRVTFANERFAMDAYDDVKDDPDLNFSLVPITYQRNESTTQQGYTLKVTWCRRPAKDHCFVYLERPEDKINLIMSRLNVQGQSLRISLSRQQSDLYIKGLKPSATEDDIYGGLEECLGLDPGEGNGRFKVVIPRVNVILRADEKYESERLLTQVLARYAEPNSFKVSVIPYRQQTVTVIAYVTFTDIDVAEKVCRDICENKPVVERYPISADMEFKSGIHVHKRVYNVVSQDIKRMRSHYQNSKATVIDVKELKSGHYTVDIKSTNLQNLARAKVRFDDLLQGQVLAASEVENLGHLFSKEGRNKLEIIERNTKTLITPDERQMKITVQGQQGGVQNAVVSIKQEIDKFVNTKEQEIRLKGDENPPGLLKALFLRYGVKFAGLRSECGLSKISINMRSREICLAGKEEALAKALELVKEERDKLNKGKADTGDTFLPDCPVCLCPIEETEIFRLEFCGHAYCKPCLILQLQTAIRDREFPVRCSAENCEEPLVIRDFKMQIKNGTIKQSQLAMAALNAYVSEHSEEYRFCITPDCSMVYKVTSTGNRFICGICSKHICTSCHLEYHNGLTCAMYKSAKQDGDSVLKWIQEDPDNRKKCPKCAFGIEKIDGCDHMNCKCGAHICWKCLEYFDSIRSCYGHLSRAHGTFV